jgi:GNAT superfamily N-acetyltransferase
METEMIVIGQHDGAWHDRFFRHVSEVFEGIDFYRWTTLGGWSEDYEVFAIIEDNEILATIGVSRMYFSSTDIPGQPAPAKMMDGLQLGAVATRKDRRGMGYARRLMDMVLAQADRTAAPVLLFANPSVIDFYPKFGFRRLLPQGLSVPIELAPGKNQARRFDPAVAADRRRLAELCATSPAHRGALSAKSDPSILLWYLCNDLTGGYVTEGETSIVFAAQKGDQLHLQDWIGAPPGNLEMALVSILSAPITVITLGFLAPAGWWSRHLKMEDDHTSFMFWRGADLPPGPMCFPALMQT